MAKKAQAPDWLLAARPPNLAACCLPLCVCSGGWALFFGMEVLAIVSVLRLYPNNPEAAVSVGFEKSLGGRGGVRG